MLERNDEKNNMNSKYLQVAARKEVCAAKLVTQIEVFDFVYL